MRGGVPLGTVRLGERALTPKIREIRDNDKQQANVWEYMSYIIMILYVYYIYMCVCLAYM